MSTQSQAQMCAFDVPVVQPALAVLSCQGPLSQVVRLMEARLAALPGEC
jgi:hypothetical protein